jgi:hypothetical protein
MGINQLVGDLEAELYAEEIGVPVLKIWRNSKPLSLLQPMQLMCTTVSTVVAPLALKDLNKQSPNIESQPHTMDRRLAPLSQALSPNGPSCISCHAQCYHSFRRTQGPVSTATSPAVAGPITSRPQHKRLQHPVSSALIVASPSVLSTAIPIGIATLASQDPTMAGPPTTTDPVGGPTITSSPQNTPAPLTH